MKEEIYSSCSYCKGDGYFQLITGGTETCPSCGGRGDSESISGTMKGSA